MKRKSRFLRAEPRGWGGQVMSELKAPTPYKRQRQRSSKIFVPRSSGGRTFRSDSNGDEQNQALAPEIQTAPREYR
jgi:hypothetical protein